MEAWLATSTAVTPTSQNPGKEIPTPIKVTHCFLRDLNAFLKKQGKSEGFESCDRPIVRKRPIWVKIGDVLSPVTLKFDG